jgi:mono/diheme cytochrome c family protein
VLTDGSEATHEHTYPSRIQCVSCHSRAAGRALGLQTAQFNRARAYADAVDNQLRALAHIGLFGTTFPDGAAEALPRLPSPNDVGQTLENRSRAYFHSNCAHCHRPFGPRPTIDFRFSSAMSDTNVCNMLTPGDADGSLLYQRDSVRGSGQMPPIASILRDDRQLAVTAAWINGMTTCP